MIEEKARGIEVVPKTYSEWLDCFDVLANKNVSRDEIKLLCMGECTASEESIGFLETQLVKTINKMIKRYIQAFNRELEMRTIYNEYDNLSLLFVNLANKLNRCMFFKHLNFLSTEFKSELEASIIDETNKFWKSMLDSMYSLCIEQNNSYLEDELYMIKRIRLYKKEDFR